MHASRIAAVMVVTTALLVGCGPEPVPVPGQAGTPAANATTQPARSSNDEAGKLHRVVEEYFDQYLALNPLRASELGDHRFDDRFGDYASASWMADSLGIEQESLERLAAIEPSRLGGEDLITYAAFKRQRELNIAGYRYPMELLPIDPFVDLPGEFALLGSGRGSHPFRTTRDYDNFLRRMDGFVAWVEQAINNMRAGVTKGVVLPVAIVERALPRLAELSRVDDPRASVFWQPLLNFPPAPPVADRRRLLAAYEQKLRLQVLPAYRRLHDYLAEEYLPEARTTVGWSALPSGDFWYAQLVRQYTSSELTPESAHELGLREVARLQGEAERLGGALGVTGDLREMAAALRNDPARHIVGSRALLAQYASIQERLAPRLSALFARVPRAALELRAAGASPRGVPAWYRAPNGDGSRPGMLFVDTQDPASGAAWTIEAQYLHEGLPGRHLQTALAQEAERLPRFRRFGTDAAFADGWAAYAASLGNELGAHVEPIGRFGAVAMELTRAARLVIDTGLHARGWSRPQAIDYLLAHTTLDAAGSAIEVDRCIAEPGVGLAGHVGELKILELRRRAHAQLGNDFDVREFHEQIAGGGALPLPVLELKIRRWIEQRKR